MSTALDDLLARTIRGEQPGLPTGWQEQTDFAEEIGRIQFHGIALMLADDASAMAAWPLALRAAVIDEAHQQLFWEEAHRRMLQRLLGDLAAAGVIAVIMKGTALAYSVYEQPATRRRGDTDLLVRPGQLATVRQVLMACGLHRRADPHGLLYQEGWLLDTAYGTEQGLDLHWKANDSPVLQQVLRDAEFHDRALPLERLCPAARMADPVLTFLQVALNRASHAAHGYFVEDQRINDGDRLIWASDFDRLAQRLTDAQWGELARLAHERQVAPLVHDALLFARTMLRTNVPSDVLQRLDDGPQTTPITTYLAQGDSRLRYAADFRALPNLAAWWNFIHRLACPPAAYLSRRFPASAGWPVAALYLRWLLDNGWALVSGKRR